MVTKTVKLIFKDGREISTYGVPAGAIKLRWAEPTNTASVEDYRNLEFRQPFKEYDFQVEIHGDPFVFYEV